MSESAATPSDADSHDDAGTDEGRDEVRLAVHQTNYTSRTRPDGSEVATVHLFGRRSDRKLYHVAVHGFSPYFYAPEGEAAAEDEWGIRNVDSVDTPTLKGDGVDRVATNLPKHVKHVRDNYDTHYEADIPFPDRFLIDRGITEGITVPVPDDAAGPGEGSASDPIERIDVSDPEAVRPASIEEGETPDPRLNIFDIEVEDRNGFPEAEDANEPIISITAWDSYCEEYRVLVQKHENSPPIPETLPDYTPIPDHVDDEEDADADDAADGENADAKAEGDGTDGANPDCSVHVFDSEGAMLLAFINYLRATDPDLVCAWNVNEFDMLYLVNRVERVSAPDDPCDDPNRQTRLTADALSRVDEVWTGGWRGGPDVKGRVVFDLLDAYRRMQFSELDSYRLEAVGQEEFGVGKEFYEGKVGDLWEENPQRLIEYNLRDVELCVELNRRQEIAAFWDEVSSFAGCRLEDATIPSDVVDRYILRKTHGQYALQSRGQKSGEEFEGGAVFDAASGVKENVIVLDLASLYPMSMSTINASPETKIDDPSEYEGETRHAPNGIHYRTDRDGIIREVIDELLGERNRFKQLRDEHPPGTDEYEKYDRQQASVKVIMNSLFGVLGWVRFRLYDEDNAAAITSTGREVLAFTEEVVNDLGHEVIYGDTDSVMISFGPGQSKDEIKERAFEIEAAINERYDEFARERLDAEDHRFEVEFEKLYRRYFQAGKKKRYAGHITWKDGKDMDEVDITGFEYQRSDVAPITKRVQHEIIEMIVHGRENEEIRDRLHEIIVNFREGDVGIGDVGIPMGIGQPLDEYDNDPAHARGARYANVLLGTNFGSGSKPKRLYLDGVDNAFFDRIDGTDNGGDELDVHLASNADRSDLADFRRNRDVICFDRSEQIPDEFNIDWDKMLAKTLKGPISRVIDPLGIAWDNVKAGQTQHGLDSFM